MTRSKGEIVALLLIAAALAVLLGAAVVLIDREAASTAGENAKTSILAESALSASAAARNASSFAVVLVAEHASPQVRREARAHLDDAIALLRNRQENLASALTADESSVLEPRYEAFVTELEALNGPLVAGDVDGSLLGLGEVSATYRDLAEVIGEIRDAHTVDATSAAEAVGRAATVVRFLIIFVIPFAILLIFWRQMRRTTRERILAAELAQEREVLRSRDIFIADISHELRTPLTGIYGFATTIEDTETSLSAEGAEMLNLIITEAAELSRMVDDLVTMGRLDANSITFKLGRVELDPEIAEVLDPFRRRELSIEHQGGGLAAKADQLRLRQVLRNLVSNAAKYGNGEIAVTTYAHEDAVSIEVLDNGPGVAPEIEQRLFERYVHQSGTAVLEGSIGLGLAIAKTLTEGMGGELAYERTEGITVFRVTLPADRGGHGPRRRAQASQPVLAT